MQPLSIYAGRTPTLLQWQNASRSINLNSQSLTQAQIQLASGRAVLRPSDDPLGAGAVSVLDSLLEAQQQRASNLAHGESLLGMVDGSLAEALNLILEAKGIGLEQSSSGVDSATREAAAQSIDAILDRIFEVGNTSYRGINLFGGQSSAKKPFVDVAGSIEYIGLGGGLLTDLQLATGVPITVTGEEAFGAVSTRVEGHRDLNPTLDYNTYIHDLNGSQGLGVSLGIIQISLNEGGLRPTEIDLTDAWTIQDVVDKFNQSDLVNISVDINSSGHGLIVQGNGLQTITITDPPGGRTARDLGLDVIDGSGNEIGRDIDRRLTDYTPISALGITLGSLRLNNGLEEIDLDLSQIQTIRELRYAVADVDMGIRLDLNEAGDRLDVVNLRSGSLMSVGETLGGTTATDLGIRSMDRETRLADFNRGLGVTILSGNIDPTTGAPDPDRDRDFAITLSNGERFEVDLAGSTTVGDVLDRIEAAAEAALLDPGVFTVGLADVGNGIVLQDLSGGTGTFGVENLNGSTAAADLGLLTGIEQAGATIVGEDRAMVAVESIFTHLMDLREALRADDVSGTALAVDRIEQDLDRLDGLIAKVGIRADRLADARARNENAMIMDQQLRSRIVDLDYTEASIRFASLQQQLQAGLATTARSISQSLLDYL